MPAWLPLKDLPAWLQAFAAIVALGISVWAVWQTNAGERRKDRLRAHGIAVAIYPELLKLTGVLQNVRDSLARLKTNSRVLVGQTIAATVQTGKVPIPPMLERNVDNFYLLGEPAGPTCLQLVSILLQYNSLVEDVAARIVIMNAQQWPEAIEHLESHLDLIFQVVSKCAEDVRPIHDAVKG